MDRETAVAALQRVAVCALKLHNALADLDPEQSAAYAAEARMEAVGAPPVPTP